MIVSESAIQALCNEIVQQFQPEMVVLFGSYAYGKPHIDSDLDLLVIMPFEGKPFHQSIAIGQAISHPIALDIIARTPQDIQKRYRGNDPLVREAIDKGRVLYERTAGSRQRMAS